MKKKLWRKVKGFPNYKISNYGDVVNIHTNKKLNTHFNGKVVCLSKNNKSTNKSLSRLILKHFTKIPPKFVSVFKDGNSKNMKLSNLKRGTMSEAFLLQRRYKNKLRGVYKFNRSKSKKKWRAAVQINKKPVTLGYYKTKKEAIKAFYTGYKNVYNTKPFNLKKYVK